MLKGEHLLKLRIFGLTEKAEDFILGGFQP